MLFWNNYEIDSCTQIKFKDEHLLKYFIQKLFQQATNYQTKIYFKQRTILYNDEVSLRNHNSNNSQKMCWYRFVQYLILFNFLIVFQLFDWFVWKRLITCLICESDYTISSGQLSKSLLLLMCINWSICGIKSHC